MVSDKVAKCLVDTLSSEGVNYIFSLPGGHILPVYDVLYDFMDLKLITTHSETAAAFMADAYARITGRLGTLLVTAGPGVAYSIPGLAEAYTASSPVLAIAGQVASNVLGTGALQELNHIGLVEVITKAALFVHRPDAFPYILRKAIRIALSGRKGPVLLDVPRDFWNEKIEYEIYEPARYRCVSEPMGDLQAIEEAAKILLEAEYPIIIAGGGTKWSKAGPVIIKLAELLGIPVITTFMGKGVVPEDHQLVFGVGGYRVRNDAADEYLEKSDLALVIGCRFSGSFTGDKKLKLPKRIIQIDIDHSEIGKNYFATIGIVGDAKQTLFSLINVIEKHIRNRPELSSIVERRKHEIIEMKKRYLKIILREEEDKLKSVTIKPQTLFNIMRKLIPKDSIIVTDAGAHQVWAIERWFVGEGGSFVTPLGLGTMGFSLPASIAVKLAHPNKHVIAISGDAGFMMTMAELETAKRYNLDLIIILYDNKATGIIKQAQKLKYKGRIIGTVFSEIDFTEIAKGFSVEGFKVETPYDLEHALESALYTRGVKLIDVIVDETGVYPVWVKGK